MRRSRVLPTAAAAIALLGAGAATHAEAGPAPGHPLQPYYRLVDVGTFGGPLADVQGPDLQIDPSGALLGLADTAVVDSDSPNAGVGNDDGYVHHAFSYQGGRLTDLGALPGENSSSVFEVNRHGLGVGYSETGSFDARVGVPATHAVLFARGHVIDIGTLPGGTESFAVAVNDDGLVAGVSNDRHGGPGLPEFFDWKGQIRTFVWRDGRMRDIGTLGGPGAVVDTVNARGQVNGDSYVDSAVVASSGHPTLHPFLWQDGRLRDLGTLGGSTTASRWMNDSGEVAGRATLAGDAVTHAFLWDGRRLRDLGTLGGAFASAEHVNDRGVVTGISSTAADPDRVHTFVWVDGHVTDLSPGTGRCTYPEWMSNAGDIVGGQCGFGGALLWHRGRQYDLNTLVDGRGARLGVATYVGEDGRIVAVGTTATGHQHVYLLTPCGYR